VTCALGDGEVVFWIAMLTSGFMFFADSLTRRTRGVEIDKRTEFWMNFVIWKWERFSNRSRGTGIFA
jgi:hypothetical protein